MDGPSDPQNLRDLIETAQRIQAEVTRVRDELASKTTEGESGGGLVRCQVSGTGEVLSLSIDPTLYDLPTSAAGPGQAVNDAQKRMLEDLIVGAVNVALERARELAKHEMARVTGGLPMPPGVFGG